MSSSPLELSAQEQAKADSAMCGSETYHKVVDSEAYAKTKEAAGYVWDKTCKGYDYLLTKSEEGLDLDRDGKSQLGRSWSVLSTATGVVVRNTPRYVRQARYMVQKTCVSNGTNKDADTELTGSQATEEAEKVPIVDDIEKTGNVTKVTNAPAKPVGLIQENDTKPVGLVEENTRVDPVKAHNSASVPPTLPGVSKKVVADSKRSYGASSVPTGRVPSTAAYKSSVRGH